MLGGVLAASQVCVICSTQRLGVAFAKSCGAVAAGLSLAPLQHSTEQRQNRPDCCSSVGPAVAQSLHASADADLAQTGDENLIIV